MKNSKREEARGDATKEQSKGVTKRKHKSFKNATLPHAGRAENFPPDVKRYDFNGPVLAISSRTNLPMHFVELSLLPKDIECPMQRNAIDAEGCQS